MFLKRKKISNKNNDLYTIVKVECVQQKANQNKHIAKTPKVNYSVKKIKQCKDSKDPSKHYSV